MSADFFAFSHSDGFGAPNAATLAFFIIYGTIIMLALAYSVTVYVLQSLSIYTIAKRRGIHHPGLAWVPVASTWIMGSISDQYQYVVKGKIRSRRKVLLGLSIALTALTLVFWLFGITEAVGIPADNSFHWSAAVPFAGAFFVMAIWVVSVIAMVFTYIVYYDLFMSCCPANAVLFLILGIFFNFLLPFFVLFCRKKDEGMPPRKVQIPLAPWRSEAQGSDGANPEEPAAGQTEE